jgi:hypothetical protein
MLHAVQGLPPDQRLRLAYPGVLLRVALGSKPRPMSPSPPPRSRQAAPPARPAADIG